MDLREKVARALCRFEHGDETYWTQYQPQAHAAIATILAELENPTGEMLMAVGKATRFCFTTELIKSALAAASDHLKGNSNAG